MGSDDEPGTNDIDASVGGLVWVRRRNGSWWPGQILSLDEVSESSLVSPKAGTPVKLLGRDDASVDWYNLEKSKRVKAFRCGEYDGCIEKAKAAAASSSKKAVKYARREDAIIHALEIESACSGKDPPNCHRRRQNSCSEVPTTSRFRKRSKHTNGDVTHSEGESDAAQELSQSGLSFEEPNNLNVSKVVLGHGKRRRTPNDSEDDGIEGSKRMRGLDDLGMGLGLNLKVENGGTPEKIKHGNDFHDSVNRNCKPNASLVNGNKASSVSLKRKRSQVADAHEFLKRKNRRRQLTKVLESTVMVSVPVVCDQLASSNSSPNQGASESKLSATESTLVNNNSDSTGVSSENGASLNGCQLHNKVKDSEISSVSGLVENGSSGKLFDVPFVGEDKQPADFPTIFVQSTHTEGDSLRSKVLKGSGSTDISVVHLNHSGHKIKKDASKWQLKGKRNSRPTSKNGRDDSRQRVAMKALINGYLVGGKSFSGHPLVSDKPEHKSIGGPELICEGIVHQSRPKPDAELLPGGSPTTEKILSCRASRFAVHSRYQKRSDYQARNTLYDVKVEVNAGYRPQHVPLVSLMSKVNGKAIVGHPVTVDVVEDGFCEHLLCNTELHAPTIKATGAHSIIKKTSETRRKRKKKLKSKSRRSQKSKQSASTLKKIRKLSSLTGRKLSGQDKKEMVEKHKEPVVACIPLKLVFSRISEAVKGSGRPGHRALPSSNS